MNKNEEKAIQVLQKIFTLIGLLCGVHLSYGQANAVQDSVVWRASTKYDHPSILKRIFLGTNYRKEWATPVKMPVFHLTEKGFTIKELGGGQQTISLHLTDAKGNEWVLRSVDKDVTKALPPSLRKTFVKGLAQDIVSGGHPYGALIVPTLAHTLHVAEAAPAIYFIPDDPSFGQYRHFFANTVCMLEQKETTLIDTDTKSTEKILNKIFESNKNSVDQRAVLRARLLDMLIGDWDRHAEQWRWAKESDSSSRYVIIPKDRDQAFFYSNGLFIQFAQIVALRHLVSFNDDLAKMKSLNYKEWPFDQFFLNGLDKKDWEAAIKKIQAELTNENIHAAVMQLPPEIYALDGKKIEKNLRGRRDRLMKKGLHYYRFIAARVAIYGTNEDEYFDVAGNENKITVSVFAMEGGEPKREIYKRQFLSKDTYELDLFGLKGNDRFVINDNAKSKIKIVINGAGGNDEYKISGAYKNIVINKGKERIASRKTY